MKDNRQLFSLRVSPLLLDQMRIIAKSCHRSLNGEILIAIEEYIKRKVVEEYLRQLKD